MKISDVRWVPYLDVNIADQMVTQVVTDIHFLDLAILQRTQPRQQVMQDDATYCKTKLI